MIRTLSSIAAVSLVLAQPLLMACQCHGCTGGCATAKPKADAKKTCCSAGESAGRSCCGLPAGQCPCGSRSNEGAPDDGAPRNGQSCLCSAQPQSTAIAAPAVQLDHSVGVQYFLADALSFDAGSSRLAQCLADLGDGPPGCYGGLRVHAFLGVWLI